MRLIIVRASDVPTYVQYGAADLGIAGKDVLNEHGGNGLYQPLDLQIARCRMMVAVREGYDYAGACKQGSRIRVATKYVKTAREHFASKGVHIDLIKLYGSMELAPLVGLSDVIVDLVPPAARSRPMVWWRSNISRHQFAAGGESGRAQTQARRDPAVAGRVRARGCMTAMRRLDTARSDFDARLAELLAFEAAQDPQVDASVAAILADVRQRGRCRGARIYARFDRVEANTLPELEVPRTELAGGAETHCRRRSAAR